jgi:hypothetical protein
MYQHHSLVKGGINWGPPCPQDDVEWRTFLPIVLLTLPDDVMDLYINGESHYFGSYGGNLVLASLDLKWGVNQFELRMIRTDGTETTRTVRIARPGRCDTMGKLDNVGRFVYWVWVYDNAVLAYMTPTRFPMEDIKTKKAEKTEITGTYEWTPPRARLTDYFVPAPVIPLDNAEQKTNSLRVLLKLRSLDERRKLTINSEYHDSRWDTDWTGDLIPLDLEMGLNLFELKTLNRNDYDATHDYPSQIIDYPVMITRVGNAPEDVEIGGYWLRYYYKGGASSTNLTNLMTEYFYYEGLPFPNIPMLDLEKRIEFFVPTQDGYWLHYYYDESNNLVREYITGENFSLPGEEAPKLYLPDQGKG